jgi:hypothetical protein
MAPPPASPLAASSLDHHSRAPLPRHLPLITGCCSTCCRCPRGCHLLLRCRLPRAVTGWSSTSPALQSTKTKHQTRMPGAVRCSGHHARLTKRQQQRSTQAACWSIRPAGGALLRSLCKGGGGCCRRAAGVLHCRRHWRLGGQHAVAAYLFLSPASPVGWGCSSSSALHSAHQMVSDSDWRGRAPHPLTC